MAETRRGGGGERGPSGDSVVEDYLKTIYAHTEWQDSPIPPSVLAAKLGLAPSTVTEMVKKLAAAGLVEHAPYRAVRLTETGRRRALSVVRRHRLVETWLVHEMGYRWDEVHDEAEVLEHALSDRLLAAIDARLGHPARDPHGDPIPDAQGAVHRVPALLLADAPPGHRGSVLRIDDKDPALLREAHTAGLELDRWVDVVEVEKGHRIVFRVNDEPGREGVLSADAAGAVWLSSAPGPLR